MTTETDRHDNAPFSSGDIVSVSYEATDMPRSTIGQVREFGTDPAPWLRIVGHKPEEDTVVFLGAGVVVRFMNHLRRS